MELRRQMEKHVEKWSSSGLSKAEYAARTGIGYHKLGYWIQKIEGRKKESGKFLPVGRTEEKIEIEFKNGTIVKLPYNVSEERIKSILEAAEC